MVLLNFSRLRALMTLGHEVDHYFIIPSTVMLIAMTTNSSSRFSGMIDCGQCFACILRSYAERRLHWSA